jgi:glycosyltransferase involved in cell wall biosynthesis
MGALRIVHVVSSLGSGGMEHLVLRLAAAQRARGHDARVVAVRDGALRAHARARGVPAYVLERTRRTTRALRGAACLALLAPDVVHAHNTTALHYAALGKLVSGARLVLTEHGQVYRSPHAVEWYLTDAATAVSSNTAERCAARAELPEVVVLANGVADEPASHSRAEVRAALRLRENEVVAVHVARVVPLKAHDVILRAMAMLAEQRTPIVVLFVGDGPARADMEHLAAKLGLAGKVRFLGHRDDVPDLLGASDLFLLPSRAEGLPVAVLEAMAKSLPVVATPVGGVPEVCTHEREALFVPVDDPMMLADAMAELVRDPLLRSRLGSAGRTRAMREFSFDGMVTGYEDVYRRVLANGRLARAAALAQRARWRVTRPA